LASVTVSRQAARRAEAQRVEAEHQRVLANASARDAQAQKLEAEARRVESERERARAAAERNRAERYVAAQRELALNLTGQGDNQFLAGDFKTAISLTEQTLESEEALRAEDPANLESARIIGILKQRLCIFYASSGGPEKATPLCKASIDVREPLLATRVNDRPLRSALAVSYGTYAKLEDTAKHAAAAVVYGRKAVALFTAIVYLGGINGVSNGITVSKKLFAPRVGFAWRVGDKWVVRSGYGITYDPLPFSRPLRGLYPSTITATYNTTLPEAANPDTLNGWYNTVKQGIPEVPTPDISKGTLTLPLNIDMGPRSPWGGDLHRGYIQSFNFTVERQLPLNAVGNVAYVGTRTVHQMIDIDINTAGLATGLTNASILANLPLGKLYGRTNGANMWDGWAYGTYNSLQASLNKSFSKGLFLKGAYTFSKTLNFADDDGWTGLWNWNWGPVIKRNYGPAGYDRTHMFTMGWIYELPAGKGKRFNLSGVTDKILGGWKVNGTFAAYTGTPYWVTGSSQTTRCARGCGTNGADIVGPITMIDAERGAGKPYMDPLAFRDPLLQFNRDGIYRFGTIGRGVFHGPGYWTLNPALYKEFKLTERLHTEFRAESFNVTNTPRWGNPNTNAGSMRIDPATNQLRTDIPYATALGNFMTITSASTGRQVRFGLRLHCPCGHQCRLQ
jgi:hypothetical protein